MVQTRRITTSGNLRVTTHSSFRITTIPPTDPPSRAKPITGADLLLRFSNAGSADLVIENGDLVMDGGVTTAVIVSLFSDARALTDQLSAPDENPRGWWGQEDLQFGSLMWVLTRSKLVELTLEVARESTLNALAWMIAVDLAESVVVTPSIQPGGLLLIEVIPTRGTARRWADLWEQMDPVTYTQQGVQLRLVWG